MTYTQMTKSKTSMTSRMMKRRSQMTTSRTPPLSAGRRPTYPGPRSLETYTPSKIILREREREKWMRQK